MKQSARSKRTCQASRLRSRATPSHLGDRTPTRTESSTGRGAEGAPPEKSGRSAGPRREAGSFESEEASLGAVIGRAESVGLDEASR
jgi:hypothetical protein